MPYQPIVPSRAEFLQVRGLRHRVLRWGPPVDDPLVLLHGFQDCSDTFQFLIDQLPRDWGFIGVDWRGFGGSESTGQPYWFPDYVADLEALLDALLPDRPVTLVGHSMGGNVASLYAGIRPARVGRLVSLEGFGLPRSRPDQAPARYAEWLDQLKNPPRGSHYGSVGELAALLARRNPRLPRENAEFVAEAWTRDTGPPLQLHFDPWHRVVNPVLYRREETEACWRSITAPTLMVLGGQSEYRIRLMEGAQDDLFGPHFARLTVAMLPELGHMLHHEDPQAVARAMTEWFAA